MSVIATDTSSFEHSEAWRDVEVTLSYFAEAFEVDEEVLITAVSETVNSIINGEEI